MQQSLPLRRLAHAMLAGASLGCEQTRKGCYWSVVDHDANGAPVYAFCAIGCANLGLLGHVPKYLEPHQRRFGMTWLSKELGVDWNMSVFLPDGSRERLANAICYLNDHTCWSIVCIAVWLFLMEVGWTVEAGSLCWRKDDEPPLLLDLLHYHEVVAKIERAYGRDPSHPTWEHIADPTWWVSRIPGARLDAGSANP